MPGTATVPLEPDRLALVYLTIKERVIASGFSEEIDWQSERDFDRITESELLREAAWVVLSSGFRESVVRRTFPGISTAFLDWVGAKEIVRWIEQCKDAALRVFAHRGKIGAIASIVRLVAEARFSKIKQRIRHEGVAFIREWPFMGPVTSLHLAKNLGLPVVKPDRHLLRAASTAGYPSPEQMCRTIANIVGDSMAVVDVVIWRYATIEPDYLTSFRRTKSSPRLTRRRVAA
jgi:hypothetical protein